MYRIVLVLASLSALGLLVGLGLDLTGLVSGESVWSSALGLSVLGHVVAIVFLAVSGVRIHAEAREGRRAEWAAAQAERNVRRVVPTTAGAVVLLLVAGWLTMAASTSPRLEALSLVARVVSALAAGVSIAGHGWEALSARTQNRLAQSQDQPGRPGVAGRFSQITPRLSTTGESS